MPRTDEPGARYSRGVRRVTALPLASRRLGLAGVADVVEFHRSGGVETPYPVEFKRGKPKAHRADEAQLCAQGLCLEEMTGRPVPEGALFYGETRRRVEVRFDDELRRLTENAAAALERALRLRPHARGRIRAKASAARARSSISAGRRPSGVRRRPGASGRCEPRSTIARRTDGP